MITVTAVSASFQATDMSSVHVSPPAAAMVVTNVVATQPYI